MAPPKKGKSKRKKSRDYVLATYYSRVQRLDPDQHPIAAIARDWQAAGSPLFRPCVSFLPRAAALCRRLCRFADFEDGGADFLEPIPSPPVRKLKSYQRRPIDKESAKAAHIKLVNKLNYAEDIVMYTDGSAAPNPGRIGLGVSATCAG